MTTYNDPAFDSDMAALRREQLIADCDGDDEHFDVEPDDDDECNELISYDDWDEQDFY